MPPTFDNSDRAHRFAAGGALGAAPVRARVSAGATLLLLAAVLALALWLRLDRLNSVYWFSGDQGRQGLVIHGMFHGGEWPLQGATHSYGGSNYGPAYYYLYVPSYLLMRGDARFGGVTQAVLGTLAILVVFLLVRQCGGSPRAAFIAALLLAVNPHAVWMDRTMWNPHDLPFFAVFTFWYAGALLDGKR